jgi:hypothetical protein
MTDGFPIYRHSGVATASFSYSCSMSVSTIVGDGEAALEAQKRSASPEEQHVWTPEEPIKRVIELGEDMQKTITVCDKCDRGELSLHEISVQTTKAQHAVELCANCAIDELIALVGGLKLEEQETWRKKFQSGNCSEEIS